MARKHPKDMNRQDIVDLVSGYIEEAFLQNTEDLANAVQELRDKCFDYSFKKKNAKGYFIWLKEKVFSDIYEQKVKADIRNKKIETIINDE